MVFRSEVEEDIEVREVYIIIEVGGELEDGVDKRYEEVLVNTDFYEEEIKDVVLSDERGCHWGVIF